MPGRGTTDVIFILRQLQQTYKDLFFAFVNLEKAIGAYKETGKKEWFARFV